MAIYHRDEVITYRELQGRVNRAATCSGRTDRIDDRVILLLADKPQFIETYVGAMMVPLPVPINELSTPHRSRTTSTIRAR